ncbi:MAG: hypothetical protein MK108_13415 [Mariniblastus sp.]|nr:hypothetical protein [Mariniblastus sp.]
MHSLLLACQDISPSALRLLQEPHDVPMFTGDVMPVSFWALLLLLTSIVLAVSLVVSILVAWFIYKPYSKLPPAYQTLSPGLIWLLLVPLANLVIMLLIVLQVPDAFRKYFDHVGDSSVGDCGKLVGQIWAIATLCCFVPVVNYVAVFPAIACMILFTVKLWELAGKIGNKAPRADGKIRLPKSVV